MKTYTKWLMILAINGAAQLVFWGLTSLMGYEWSWKLYWCAFAVYVVLRLGDSLLDGEFKEKEAPEAP